MPNWTGDDGVSDFDTRLLTKNNKMPAKRIRKSTVKTVKPTLIVVGESFVDPNDVSVIKKIRSKTDLYIIHLKSQPNAQFPMWANGEEVALLIKHFNIIE